VVVLAASMHILVDGFKRVRALKHLKHDTVRAIRWDLEEREARTHERPRSGPPVPPGPT